MRETLGRLLTAPLRAVRGFWDQVPVEIYSPSRRDKRTRLDPESEWIRSSREGAARHRAMYPEFDIEDAQLTKGTLSLVRETGVPVPPTPPSVA